MVSESRKTNIFCFSSYGQEDYKQQESEAENEEYGNQENDEYGDQEEEDEPELYFEDIALNSHYQ